MGGFFVSQRDIWLSDESYVLLDLSVERIMPSDNLGKKLIQPLSR